MTNVDQSQYSTRYVNNNTSNYNQYNKASLDTNSNLGSPLHQLSKQYHNNDDINVYNNQMNPNL